MNIFILGGSSFIGKNLISKIPSEWNIRATYNTSTTFLNYIKNFPNVDPIKINLFDNELPEIYSSEVVLYLAGISPGQAGLETIDGLNKMDFLHAKVISSIFNNISECKKFIYFSSGIHYLWNDYSPYRKSRMIGEANLKLHSKAKNISYVIIRNMEIYGDYMAKHKIYRKICNAAIDGKNKIDINGDGKNFIDTMFIDDYVDIIIELISSGISNETIDICKSEPVTVKDLIYTTYNVLNKDKPEINFFGNPTEATDFILSNAKMLSLFNSAPNTSLESGLKKWINNGLK